MSKGPNRNIYIMPKGYAMLAAIDRGDYIPLSTKDARSKAGTRQCIAINKKRRAKKQRDGDNGS